MVSSCQLVGALTSPGLLLSLGKVVGHERARVGKDNG